MLFNIKHEVRTSHFEHDIMNECRHHILKIVVRYIYINYVKTSYFQYFLRVRIQIKTLIDWHFTENVLFLHCNFITFLTINPKVIHFPSTSNVNSIIIVIFNGFTILSPTPLLKEFLQCLSSLKICTTLGYIVSLFLLNLEHVSQVPRVVHTFKFKMFHQEASVETIKLISPLSYNCFRS